MGWGRKEGGGGGRTATLFQKTEGGGEHESHTTSHLKAIALIAGALIVNLLIFNPALLSADQHINFSMFYPLPSPDISVNPRSMFVHF